jgi:hypothetical protein
VKLSKLEPGNNLTASARSKAQRFRIRNPLQPCFNGPQEVDSGFAKTGSRDDGVIQIGVREKTETHDFFSLIA